MLADMPHWQQTPWRMAGHYAVFFALCKEIRVCLLKANDSPSPGALRYNPHTRFFPVPIPCP